ncbi:hypothetical protein MMC07_001912 [Pseudocyphellaria aurata]|nr:hypothetical protein [Pseudocyphellaria aurata]
MGKSHFHIQRNTGVTGIRAITLELEYQTKYFRWTEGTESNANTPPDLPSAAILRQHAAAGQRPHHTTTPPPPPLIPHGRYGQAMRLAMIHLDTTSTMTITGPGEEEEEEEEEKEEWMAWSFDASCHEVASTIKQQYWSWS